MRWLRYLMLIPVIVALSCSQPPIIPPEDRPFLYDSITFDVAHVGSAFPQQEALEGFRVSLNEQRLCGAATVSFAVRPARTLETNLIWNVPMFNAFETTNGGRRSRSEDAGDLMVFVAYVRGSFLPPPTPGRIVCGYTYNRTAFAALVDHYDHNRQEAALLLHEFGHVLNLPGDDHCPNTNCVMYEFVREDGARFCSGCLDRIDQLRD